MNINIYKYSPQLACLHLSCKIRDQSCCNLDVHNHAVVFI